MRRSTILFASVTMTLLGCGVFGSSDEPEPAPPPADPGLPPAVPLGGTPLEGVFVSASKGDDSNDGTSASAPMKTLGAAFARAAEKQLPVYACAETYAESLVLVDGVSADGAYDCSSEEWTKIDKHAVVQSPTIPAVTAKSLTKLTVLEGFDLIAPDATTPGEASIAVVAKGSPTLAIRDALVRAGRGGPGVDGVEPAADAQKELSTKVNGTSGLGEGACDIGTTCFLSLVGGLPGPVVAKRGSGGESNCLVKANGANGGAGGDGGRGGIYTSTGSGPPDDFDTSGQAASATTAAPGKNAGGGSPGAAGQAGEAGANGTWKLTAAGFIPGDGTAGAMGLPGQGGGGGGGYRDYCLNNYTGGPFQLKCQAGSPEYLGSTWHAGTGSGGGAGGCGGVPGTPGTGGGASIALFLVDSPVTLDDVDITTGAGGRAGKGTLGLKGLAGGQGGPLVNWGGPGGHGGAGGDAGLSGNGAPGPSIGMAVHGAVPKPTDVRFHLGEGGEGQPALTRGAQTLPAVAGESKELATF